MSDESSEVIGKGPTLGASLGKDRDGGFRAAADRIVPRHNEVEGSDTNTRLVDDIIAQEKEQAKIAADILMEKGDRVGEALGSVRDRGLVDVPTIKPEEAPPLKKAA